MTLNLKLHPFTAIRNGLVLGHFSNAALAIQTIQIFGRGFSLSDTEVYNRHTGKSILPRDFMATIREAEIERKRKANALLV